MNRKRDIPDWLEYCLIIAGIIFVICVVCPLVFEKIFLRVPLAFFILWISCPILAWGLRAFASQLSFTYKGFYKARAYLVGLAVVLSFMFFGSYPLLKDVLRSQGFSMGRVLRYVSEWVLIGLLFGIPFLTWRAAGPPILEDYITYEDCPECDMPHRIDMRGKHVRRKHKAWVDCENCGVRFSYTNLKLRPLKQEDDRSLSQINNLKVNGFQHEEREIWDPRDFGPFDRCIYCFTPNNDDFAFCVFCGHISTVFSMPHDASDVTCHNHKSSDAIGYCCLCDEPMCGECNNKEKQHFSITAAHDLYYCRRCVQKSEALKQTFLRATKEQGFCAKHHEDKATFECIDCDLSLCQICSYFKRVGWFRKKVGEGPYCLVCFRGATFKGGHSRWISGSEAIKKGLLAQLAVD